MVPGRVQAVLVSQPLMWRLFGWYRISMNVAGYQDNQERVSTLLPVGTLDDVLMSMWLVLPELTDRDPSGAMARAVTGSGSDEGFTPSPKRARLVDPWQWKQRGVRAGDGALMIRSGRFTRVFTVVPHQRTQSLGVTQGPLQRARQLASLTVHSTPGPVRPVAENLDLAAAWTCWISRQRAPARAEGPSVANSASRLAVGVVGAGRVGAVLAAALREAGHLVVGASGVSEASASRIDTLLPGVPTMTPDDVVAAADLVLLTVPDDALGPLCSGLAALGAFKPGQLVVHTAGRFGVGILADAAAAGVLPLAIHPAMTFTGTSLDRARLAGTVFAVTAPAPLLPIAQALVVEMGGEPVVLAEEDRPAYHAAIVHAANHGGDACRAVRCGARAAWDRGAWAGAGAGGAGFDRQRAAGCARLGVVADGAGCARRRGHGRRAPCRTRGRARHARGLSRDGSRHCGSGARRRADWARGIRRPHRDVGIGGGLMKLITAVGELPPARGRRGVVMTMGALHEGHVALVRAAREACDEVVVTIFVNPCSSTTPPTSSAIRAASMPTLRSSSRWAWTWFLPQLSPTSTRQGSRW